MSRGVEVTSRPTWEAALEEANRRVTLCREKFGDAEGSHRWRLRITRRRRRTDGRYRWVITFEGGH